MKSTALIAIVGLAAVGGVVALLRSPAQAAGPKPLRFTFVDGGKVNHDATLAIDDGGPGQKLLLDVLGKPYRIPVSIHLDPSSGPSYGKGATGITTPIAIVSYALLHLLRDVWKASYGARVAVEIDGRRLVARYQEHPADASKPVPHPGVTVYEAT